MGPWEERSATNGGARSAERNTIGSNQTGFWSYKLVKVSIKPWSSKRMQYFRACAQIWSMRKKLLANQQEDGYGLVQNIVTNLGKGSRKGLTEGLREFINIDNERAFEVGYLNRGTGTFKVRKPKVPEGCLEVTVRESSDERTLRVGTLKTYINVNHIEEEGLGPPLVDCDWYAFCQALSKGVDGEDWGEMYETCKEMSRAVGVKKPQEAQKAKALWENEGGQGCGRIIPRPHA